jgi:AraC family transcriptional regulator
MVISSPTSLFACPTTSAMVLDYAAFALNAHFAQTFGDMRSASTAASGGLAPSQERRAAELLSSRLGGDISLEELANECRLSRSHFGRVFKNTTGHSPNAWLLRLRVRNAKRLLIESDTPICEIALTCGFADQSHLTKVFSNIVGTTPGAWRRALRG